MSIRPDSPWHYAGAFYALVKAQTKLHILIRFVGKTELFIESESDNEVINSQLNEIEQHLKSARQNLMATKMIDLTQKIEAQLALKDCNTGELKDATGATYPEIFTALKQLLDAGKAQYYFIYTMPLPTLTYQLKKPFWKI
ncbi:hypothetical protein [Nostoc sp. TCL240-02]|uniref:hypothetical protein n=1 Tax=Nostoc sp. TCL240-02 TaxID=2572090 RepID=UPI00157F8ACC|nr:hypothetical protein [Nostoc sp. TCL240-02]QKQ75573.1 hypothetical protein FBB35_21820 [Nostoc sp. TCL240-02]